MAENFPTIQSVVDEYASIAAQDPDFDYKIDNVLAHSIWKFVERINEHEGSVEELVNICDTYFAEVAAFVKYNGFNELYHIRFFTRVNPHESFDIRFYIWQKLYETLGDETTYYFDPIGEPQRLWLLPSCYWVNIYGLAVATDTIKCFDYFMHKNNIKSATAVLFWYIASSAEENPYEKIDTMLSVLADPAELAAPVKFDEQVVAKVSHAEIPITSYNAYFAKIAAQTSFTNLLKMFIYIKKIGNTNFIDDIEGDSTRLRKRSCAHLKYFPPIAYHEHYTYLINVIYGRRS